MNSYFLPSAAAVLIAIVAWFLYATWLQPGVVAEPLVAPLVSEPSLASTTPTILTRDQMAGSTVVVESASLPIAGWVVVHEMNGGHVGNALGAARRDAGVHTAIVVELLRDTATSSPYAVILYEDNGDKEFQLRTDLPIVSAQGDPLIATFKTN